MEEKGRYVMGYQRITNLQRDGLQKVIRMERDFSYMTGVFFASQNTFILRGKTTFAIHLPIFLDNASAEEEMS